MEKQPIVQHPKIVKDQSIDGQKSKEINGGEVTFSNINFHMDPGATAYLAITAEIIKEFNTNLITEG